MTKVVKIPSTMEGRRSLFLLSVILLHSSISDCFQWSAIQQSSYVINSYIGSMATLPCHFLLSDQEDKQSQQFHLLLWSRENPIGSKQWEALVTKTHISGINQSSHSYNSAKFTLTNNSLTISNIGIDDATQYQCEVKSSFYTTPSIMKVNVVYKPENTKISGPSEAVPLKSATTINCTATGNPNPGFSFYHNSKLVQNSTSQHYVISETLKHHEGEYTCIPWNYYGQGPNGTLTVQVQDNTISTVNGILSDEVIAGITGGVVLLLIIIVVAAVMCQRLRSDKQESKRNMNKTRNSNKEMTESHVGPAMYGSDASIAKVKPGSISREDHLSQTDIGPVMYGINVSQANGKYSLGKPALYRLEGTSKTSQS